MAKAKQTGRLVDWTFHNLGEDCDKATRMRLNVLLTPAVKGHAAQLLACAKVIRATALMLQRSESKDASR